METKNIHRLTQFTYGERVEEYVGPVSTATLIDLFAAKECLPDIDFPNQSICGLGLYISGHYESGKAGVELFKRTAKSINNSNQGLRAIVEENVVKSAVAGDRPTADMVVVGEPLQAIVAAFTGPMCLPCLKAEWLIEPTMRRYQERNLAPPSLPSRIFFVNPGYRLDFR